MLEFDYVYDFLLKANFKPVDTNQVPDARNYGYVSRIMSPKPTLKIYYPDIFGVRESDNSNQRGVSIYQVRTGETGHEGNFLGRECDGVIFSECAEFSNLKYLIGHRILRAVASRKGRFIMPTTPQGLGYLKNEICEWGNRNSEKYQSEWATLGPYKSTDGAMEQSEFEYAKKLLGEDNPAFQEQYLGLFTARSGRVYPNFLPDTHVYSLSQEQKFFQRSHYCNHQILLGIDFGWQNPAACLFVAKIGERHYVFDEIFGPQIQITDFADMIKEKLRLWGIKSFTAYADNDYQQTNILNKRGVFTLPARKQDKFTRREFVRLQFNMQPDGLPNIVISERCKNTIREHLEYHYKVSKNETVNPSELPEEKDNHSCDALSYLIWTPRYLYSTSKREQVR
jgi:hypothetical protein